MPVEHEVKSMEMGNREFEGNLRVFKFPEILQFLSMGKRNGVLKLSREDRDVELAFRDGKIVNVSTDEHYLRLGQMLIYSGKLTRETLQQALEAQNRGGKVKLLGEILVEQGAIPLDDLKAAIQLQLEEEIWELFSWESGNFRFEQVPPQESQVVSVELEVAPLLQVGLRRMEEWQSLIAHINNPMEVFAINPEFSGPPEQPLDEKTWRVLSLINGRLPVEAIARFSNLGRFDTYWALDHLLHLEIISRGLDPNAEKDKMLIPHATERHAPIASSTDGEKGDKGETDNKGSLLGLLGRKKGGGKDSGKGAARADLAPSGQAPPKEFLTDVGLVCSLVNALIEAVQAEIAAPAQPDWIGWLWRMAEQRHPRADAIRYNAHRLASEQYDRYAKLEGKVTKAISGAHDDSMGALRLFWGKLKERALESLGDEKRVAQLVERASRSHQNCTAVIGAPEFTLSRWMSEVTT